MFRFRRRELNRRSDSSGKERDREWPKINERSDRSRWKSEKTKAESSDEGAARQVVHYRADDRVHGDSLEQRRAAGDDGYTDDQNGGDNGDDLLDALLARTDAGDMLGDARAAVGAYAAALDDQVGLAFRAFDFGSQGHRRKRYEVGAPLARPSSVAPCGATR